MVSSFCLYALLVKIYVIFYVKNFYFLIILITKVKQYILHFYQESRCKQIYKWIHCKFCDAQSRYLSE